MHPMMIMALVDDVARERRSECEGSRARFLAGTDGQSAGPAVRDWRPWANSGDACASLRGCGYACRRSRPAPGPPARSSPGRLATLNESEETR